MHPVFALDTFALVITYTEALKLIFEKAAPLAELHASERVSLASCVGRITAVEVEGSWNLPAFDTSAMDGFAVRSQETAGASFETPLTFEILGSLAAGDTAALTRQRADDGGARAGVWEIMTGAPFPDGFDACIRQEDVTADGRFIQITRHVQPNQNRRQSGEDFRMGSTLVRAGHVIRAEDILCFAALGITEIEVRKKIRVALIATGKELVDAEQMPSGAQIRNSTTPYLREALRLRGVETIELGSVGDDPAEFLNRVQSCRDVDLILTTGAISVGKFDFVTSALEEIGLEVYFRKVKIRPGKPILFGRLPRGPFVMGLPGNPVASATGLRFFTDPFLRAAQSAQLETPIRARLAHATCKAKDATHFLKATLKRHADSTFTVQPQANQQPSMTHPLLTSNAWIALHDDAPEDVAEGTLVDVYPFTVSLPK